MEPPRLRRVDSGIQDLVAPVEILPARVITLQSKNHLSSFFLLITRAQDPSLFELFELGLLELRRFRIGRLLRALVDQHPELPAHMNRSEKIHHLLESDRLSEFEKDAATLLMDRHARLTEEIGYDNLNGMHFIISSL